MELMRVVVCVIIGCVELGSSIPYSDGNYGRNAHGAEWYTNQNFERPQNEYNSQHFSMMNRNGGEFIPRNNFQNNVPPSINNVPNNGYREYVSVPNYNSVNNMEPSSNNQMNYHHFERPIANAEASAFAGQNFNQENVNINKELAEINQMIAQENLAAIEREKLRESNFQQSYVSNVVQKPQPTEPSQNYYSQNVHFGTRQPIMQNVRPETSMPITQQTPSQEQSIIRQQSAPIPPRTQQDTEEEKKSFLVVYSDGRQERVTDLDQFIKANPDLIIQRRYQSPQLPIEQNIPQPQSQETPKQSKLKPDEQIFLPIQEQEPQKSLLIQQPLLQNIVTSKQLQDTIINKSTPSLQNNFNEITIPKVIDIATEPQLSMISKPLANSKSEEIVTTAIENMIKSVFDNFNQKQIDMSSGKDKSQTLSQSQTHSTTRKPLDPVPRPQRKIIDVNWNQKKQTESPKPITQSGKGKKMSQNNMLYSDDNITTTSNAYTSQILTPQTISDKHKFTISKNIVEKPLEENNKSKDGSSEKFEKIKENIVIPEIVFKIEDVNLQAKPFSQSEKIIVSEDVLTVEPTKEEIKIQVQEFLNKAEGSEKPIITEKIIIDTEALEDKINKQIKSKKENPEEEIIIDENIDIDNYDNTDDNSKYIQEPKLDINIIKEKAGKDKDRTTEEKQLNDASKKTKKDKLKKKEKQPNKEKPAAKKEEMDEEQIDQDEPVIEVIINREEIKPSNRYDVQKKENQSPQEEEMVMEEEEEVEPEDDNQPTKDDQNDKKEEPKRNEKQNYKEEFVKKYDEPEDEDDSEYIKALKDSIRREKLINKEIIRNGENKRDTKVKQEDGMTVITTKAGEFYVEEIKNEDLVKLQQDLNTPESKERRWLAKDAFVFKTSDATIPESIKKHSKDSKTTTYLFQLIFPPTVDREVITTIHPNGTVVEEVNEYVCEMEEQQQEELQEKKEGEQEEVDDGNEEQNTTVDRNKTEEARKKTEEKRKRTEEERKRTEEERKRTEEERKRTEVERKRKEEERKRIEEERKKSEEESKRTEEERKRTEEERKRTEEERKRREEERKRREEERKRTEEERKRTEEERKIKEEKRKRKEQERKRKTEERKRKEEERKRKEEERKRKEEERKKIEEQRKEIQEKYKKAENERKKRDEARKKAEEERKKREEKRKRYEEERKKIEEENKRNEEERKRTEEERKKTEEERKKKEEERKRIEKKRKRTEKERKRKETERKQIEDLKKKEVERKKMEERKKSVEEYEVTEEDGKKSVEERSVTEESHKKKKERRKREERKRRKQEYKKKAEEQRKTEEDEECEE